MNIYDENQLSLYQVMNKNLTSMQYWLDWLSGKGNSKHINFHS